MGASIATSAITPFTGTGDCTPTKPASVATGDLGIIAVELYTSSQGVGVISLTTLTGWTKLFTQSHANIGSLTFFYKVLDATDVSSAWTLHKSGTAFNVNWRVDCARVAAGNFDATNLVSAAAGNDATGSGTNIVCPAVTPAASGLLYLFGFIANTPVTLTVSGMSQLDTDATTYRTTSFTQSVGSGTTGTRTLAFGSTQTAYRFVGMFVIYDAPVPLESDDSSWPSSSLFEDDEPFRALAYDDDYSSILPIFPPAPIITWTSSGGAMPRGRRHRWLRR